MSYFDSSNAADILLLPHGLRDHDDLAAVAAIVEADVIARYTYSVFSDDSQAILTQGGQILGTGVAFPAGAVSISESRVVLKPLSGDRCQMEYCGDPSILWGLYRPLSH